MKDVIGELKQDGTVELNGVSTVNRRGFARKMPTHASHVQHWNTKCVVEPRSDMADALRYMYSAFAEKAAGPQGLPLVPEDSGQHLGG